MTTLQNIRRCARRIASRFSPERIILFGSYAYGTPTEDSDVDLLVVMPYHGSEGELAGRIRCALPMDMSVDVIVHTPKQLQRRLALGDFFLQEITSKGKVLYEGPNPDEPEPNRLETRW
jgi:predicted nucleotidyltransferase